MIKYKKIIYGTATYLPGFNSYLAKRNKGQGGTSSARYCYSVLLRHLVMAQQSGLDVKPEVVAELGPGKSLGVGLAALICGAEKYLAFDLIEHTDILKNLGVFDELVHLFKNKTPIPGQDEFPKVKPYLEKYDFPGDILDENRLLVCLDNNRLERIKDSIENLNKNDSMIQYKVPWHEDSLLEKESVDMIYSQAVLEHIDSLREAYRAMHSWLKPGGFMSHQIDFKSHGHARLWNGHWTYSDFEWKLIKGKRKYLINRVPYSEHLSVLKEEGFRIIAEKRVRTDSALKKDELAPRFSNLNDDDLTTSGVFLLIAKDGL